MTDIGIIIECCLILPPAVTVAFAVVLAVVDVVVEAVVAKVVVAVVAEFAVAVVMVAAVLSVVVCPLTKLNNIQAMKKVTIFK